jgi:hypothetical protein
MSGTIVERLGDGWAADEIGLAYGILGELRLRTTYQPIFERRDGLLVPVAVAAGAVLHRGGREIGAEQAATLLDVPARRLAGRLESELAIRNFSFLDWDEAAAPDLVVPLDGTARLDATALEDLVALAGATGLDAARLYFDVSDVVACLGTPIRIAQVPAGRLAADAAAAAAWPPAMAGLRPGLVRLPAAWAQRMLEDEATLRLIATLCRAVAEQGGVLQIEGIGTPMLLRRALGAGCTRLQGDFLAAAVPAGAPLDTAWRPVDAFIEGGKTRA